LSLAKTEEKIERGQTRILADCCGLFENFEIILREIKHLLRLRNKTREEEI